MHSSHKNQKKDWWFLYMYSKFVQSDQSIYLIQCSDWLFFQVRTWFYSHNTFKYNICTPTLWSSNQSTVYIRYSILIGRFWSMSTKLWLKKWSTWDNVSMFLPPLVFTGNISMTRDFTFIIGFRYQYLYFVIYYFVNLYKH
jgi:hypothetical protein